MSVLSVEVEGRRFVPVTQVEDLERRLSIVQRAADANAEERDDARATVAMLRRKLAAAADPDEPVIFAATISGIVAYAYVAGALGLDLVSTSASAVELATSLRAELAGLDLDDDGPVGEWPPLPARGGVA
ncbi:hypothetical protein [Gordonia soli]|uniref:Uncharacterized protein n=1 Tax=Gordonia soli NBRC 108243 TaxID=1223545 RepID=M0QS98_9ACTN|nr:hypothetical protein [Gordonia soli]GAC71072.1 hypothetical protein GS4_51_00100 [Gordonia soli NBRC 108243]